MDEPPLPLEAAFDPGRSLIVRFVNFEGQEFTHEFPGSDCDAQRADDLIRSAIHHITSVTATVIFHIYTWALPVDRLREARQAMVRCFSSNQATNVFALFECLLILAWQVSADDAFGELHDLLLDLFRQHYIYLSSIGPSAYPRMEHLLLLVSSQYSELNSPDHAVTCINPRTFNSLLLEFPPASFEFLLEIPECYCLFLSSTHVQEALATMYSTLPAPYHTDTAPERQVAALHEILPEAVVLLGPFVLLLERKALGFPQAMNSTIFTHLYETLRDKTDSDLTSIYIYSSLLSIHRVLASLREQASILVDTGSVSSRIESLASHFSNMCLTGSQEFRTYFTKNRLCVFIYWLCIFHATSTILDTMIPQLLYCTIHDNLSLVSALASNAFHHLISHNLDTLPLLGDLEETHHDLAKLYNLCLAGRDPTETDVISWILTTQLHIFLYHIHKFQHDPTEMKKGFALRINDIVLGPVFSSIQPCSSNIFLSLLPSWDFLFSEQYRERFGLVDANSCTTHVSTILYACRDRYDGTLSILETLHLILHLLQVTHLDFLEENELNCLHDTLKGLLLQLDTASDLCKTQSFAIDTVLVDIMSQIVTLIKSLLLTRQPNRVLRHITIIGRCISCISSHAQSIPTQALPRLKDFCRRLPSMFLCILSLVVDHHSETSKELSAATTFILSILNTDNHYIPAHHKTFNAYTMPILLLEITERIFINCSDQLVSQAFSTTSSTTTNMQCRIKQFIKYILYLATVGMLDSDELDVTDKKISYPTPIEIGRGLFLDAYPSDFIIEPLWSACTTILMRALATQGISSTVLSFKRQSTDTDSPHSGTLLAELLLVILVAVCTLPTDTCQSVILSHLHSIRMHTKACTLHIDHLNLILSIYKGLHSACDAAYVYRRHVSFSLFFLLASSGDIFKGASASSGTQDVDRDIVYSMDFCQAAAVFWVDVLQCFSKGYKMSCTEYSAYKVAVAKELPVTHEAASPFVLAELLGIHDSLNDLPHRKKLILYTFLTTLCSRSRGESLEQMCLIVPSFALLIFFIVREIVNFGLVLTLSLLENVLTMVSHVSTWEDISENLTEKMSCDIVSFWLAVVHLCDLSDSCSFLNDYPFVAELVGRCMTALGCLVDRPETFTKLRHLWAARTVPFLRDPFQFIHGIISSMEYTLIEDSMSEYRKAHEHNIYTSLQHNINLPWREFSSHLSNFIFSFSTDSIEKNIFNLVRFVILEYFDHLTTRLASSRIGKVTIQTLASLFNTTITLQALTKAVEDILEFLDTLRDALPVLISKKLRQKLTTFSQLTRFSAAYVYFLAREGDGRQTGHSDAHLRSPIAVPRFGNMSFYEFTQAREEEYYTIMLTSLDRLDRSLNVSSFAASADSSLLYNCSEKSQKDTGMPQICTLLQANMKIFTQLTPFHDSILEIELQNNGTLISLTDKRPDLINMESISDVLPALAKGEPISLSSLRNRARARLNREFISASLSLVGDISDDSFLVHQKKQGVELNDQQRTQKPKISPKNALNKLLAIESQLHSYLELSQPIELLNIHAPYTGQPYTEEQNALQQFCQNHYNIIALILSAYGGLDTNTQQSCNILNILSKRLVLFTSACIGYFMKAYTGTHPCTIDVTSRGLLYVVDFYVFNAVYRLTEISHIQKHYSMLFYLLTTKGFHIDSLLHSINRIIFIKYQFLIPLLAYWIQLFKNSPGSSISRRRLRYLPCIQSLILVDVHLAESIFFYARGEGLTKISSFAFSTFIKMLNYSYRIEAQLPTILKILNFSFPAQLRILEVEAAAKLKLLKPIVTGEDEELVALLLFKSGKLTPDLQNAIEDYESADKLVTDGRARVQKHPLPAHLKETTIYYSPRCDMTVVKGSSLGDLADKMHGLKYYNWCYRAVKKISCNGCYKDSSPHELTQLRYFQQVPPSAASHLLVASNYWKYRSAINYVCFCSSTEPFQEEVYAILQRGRSIYGLYVPAIFIQTVSFAFARAGHISIFNSVTLGADEYTLCTEKASSKEGTQQQPPLFIDFTDEYTVNSLALWYCLIKLLLSRVSNIITDHPLEPQLDDTLGKSGHFKYNPTDFSMPMFSAHKSHSTASRTELTQKLTQIMGMDVIGEEEPRSASKGNGDPKKGPGFFLPYNDSTSQYFEWIQINGRKNSYILVCSSLWQLVNMAFAEKGVIYVAVSRGDVPKYIFNNDAIRKNRSLEIAIDRYRSLFKAELDSLKLSLLHIYLIQKNFLWTASDTELAKNIIQELRL